MYNTKEKCKELAENSNRSVLKEAQRLIRSLRNPGYLPLRSVVSGGYNGTESRYPDDTLQPTWYFGQ